MSKELWICAICEKHPHCICFDDLPSKDSGVLIQLEKEGNMSDYKIHPVTKQTLEQFLAQKEEEFLLDVAQSEVLNASKAKASDNMQEAINHLLVALKCKVSNDKYVQKSFTDLLDPVVETIRDLNYEYCR